LGREERTKGGVCIDPPGFDAGKVIKGKKRHILVDTVGLLLHTLMASTDVQETTGETTRPQARCAARRP